MSSLRPLPTPFCPSNLPPTQKWPLAGQAGLAQNWRTFGLHWHTCSKYNSYFLKISTSLIVTESNKPSTGTFHYREAPQTVFLRMLQASNKNCHFFSFFACLSSFLRKRFFSIPNKIIIIINNNSTILISLVTKYCLKSADFRLIIHLISSVNFVRLLLKVLMLRQGGDFLSLSSILIRLLAKLPSFSHWKKQDFGGGEIPTLKVMARISHWNILQIFWAQYKTDSWCRKFKPKKERKWVRHTENLVRLGRGVSGEGTKVMVTAYAIH